MALQKKESTTLVSVKPIKGSSFCTFGGTVLSKLGGGLTTGSLVTNLTGSYGKSLSKITLCTSLSRSKNSGTTFSSLPAILCSKTLPSTPVDEAASTNKYFSALSSIKLQNSGSLIIIFFTSSKAFLCLSVGLKSALLLVKGDKMLICLITSMLATLLSEFTSPRKALMAFLLPGKGQFLIFSILLGSATM